MIDAFWDKQFPIRFWYQRVRVQDYEIKCAEADSTQVLCQVQSFLLLQKLLVCQHYQEITLQWQCSTLPFTRV